MGCTLLTFARENVALFCIVIIKWKTESVKKAEHDKTEDVAGSV
jgi:hypothetical protein